MEYLQVFDISSAGLDFQKLRFNAVALNLANAYTTSSTDAAAFKPLMAVAEANGDNLSLDGTMDTRLKEREEAPRLVLDPGHPHAGSDGYVRYPAINQVDEMTTMMLASRAYEANVSVLNAAKSMALKALEIGSR